MDYVKGEGTRRAEWKAGASVSTGSVPQRKPTAGLGFATSSLPTHCSSPAPSSMALDLSLSLELGLGFQEELDHRRTLIGAWR